MTITPTNLARFYNPASLAFVGATEDLRKATELAPKDMFDTMAQADAKRRLETISKGTPCGSAGASSASSSSVTARWSRRRRCAWA